MQTTSAMSFLRLRARAKLVQQSQREKANSRTFDSWRTFLTETFPDYITADFAPHHIQLWDWVWSLEKGKRPKPFVALWSRGGAKSSSAELATAMTTMLEMRRYVIYVCETQDQADKHVASIATLLETADVERALNKYGNSKGWRRERLRMNNGATIDALGLDTASRGIKVDADRPDMIVLDDIDGRHDSIRETQKKIETLTTTILATGSSDCAVLFIQNLIHPDSIASRFVDGRADFLSDRIVSGPYPAIRDLKYEARDGKYIITQGVPTWDGQSVEIAQGQINTWGLDAFLREAQHDVSRIAGSIFGDVWSEANVSTDADYIEGGGEVVWFVDDGYTGTWIPDQQNYTADSHPRVFLLAQIRPNGIVCVFYESHRIKILEEQHVDEVLALPYPKPTWAAVDKSAAQLRGRIHAKDIYTRASPSDVDESIKVMRAFIAPDVNQVRRFIIHPRVKLFQKQIKLYVADENGKPIKAFDDAMDAARYGIWALRHTQ